MSVESIITENLDIWTSAIKTKSASGRGSSSKLELHGIKKLRELILSLAVRGKLLPQSITNESAEILYKKIQAERDSLVKSKAIKKPKLLPTITHDEIPFEIPEKWLWVRLGDVTNYGQALKAEPCDVKNDTWVLELEDVEKVTSKLLSKVRFSDRKFKSSKNVFSEGDVVYGKLRPYLDKVLVADEAGVCTTEMIPVRGYRHIHPAYLRLIMKSPYFVSYANESTHGMNLPRMGTDKARLSLLPLCSEEEQKEIVTKVDELMALCDQLESQTEASIEAHQTLVKSLLETLTNAKDADGLNESWQRISAHFDVLFTTEDSTDQLKQTILQLAVMGKLVKQDPNDEPASKLLERIAAEKEQLIKDKKTKKQKNSKSISLDEQPYKLPSTWEWIRVGDVGEVKLGRQRSPKDHNGPHMVPYLRVANVLDNKIDLSDVKEMNFTPEEQAVFRLEYNDILLNEGQSKELVGRSAIYKNQIPMACFQNTLLRFRAYKGVSPEYSLLYFRHCLYSSRFQKAVKQTTNIAHLSASRLIPIEFPCPPENEQKRIVNRIESIFDLCDQLRLKVINARQTQQSIADSILCSLVS